MAATNIAILSKLSKSREHLPRCGNSPDIRVRFLDVLQLFTSPTRIASICGNEWIVFVASCSSSKCSKLLPTSERAIRHVLSAYASCSYWEALVQFPCCRVPYSELLFSSIHDCDQSHKQVSESGSSLALCYNSSVAGTRSRYVTTRNTLLISNIRQGLFESLVSTAFKRVIIYDLWRDPSLSIELKAAALFSNVGIFRRDSIVVKTPLKECHVPFEYIPVIVYQDEIFEPDLVAEFLPEMEHNKLNVQIPMDDLILLTDFYSAVGSQVALKDEPMAQHELNHVTRTTSDSDDDFVTCLEDIAYSLEMIVNSLENMKASDDEETNSDVTERLEESSLLMTSQTADDPERGSPSLLRQRLTFTVIKVWLSTLTTRWKSLSETREDVTEFDDQVDREFHEVVGEFHHQVDWEFNEVVGESDWRDGLLLYGGCGSSGEDSSSYSSHSVDLSELDIYLSSASSSSLSTQLDMSFGDLRISDLSNDEGNVLPSSEATEYQATAVKDDVPSLATDDVMLVQVEQHNAEAINQDSAEAIKLDSTEFISQSQQNAEASNPEIWKPMNEEYYSEVGTEWNAEAKHQEYTYSILYDGNAEAINKERADWVEKGFAEATDQEYMQYMNQGNVEGIHDSTIEAGTVNQHWVYISQGAFDDQQQYIPWTAENSAYNLENATNITAQELNFTFEEQCNSASGLHVINSTVAPSIGQSEEPHFVFNEQCHTGSGLDVMDSTVAPLSGQSAEPWITDTFVQEDADPWARSNSDGQSAEPWTTALCDVWFDVLSGETQSVAGLTNDDYNVQELYYNQQYVCHELQPYQSHEVHQHYACNQLPQQYANHEPQQYAYNLPQQFANHLGLPQQYGCCLPQMFEEHLYGPTRYGHVPCNW